MTMKLKLKLELSLLYRMFIPLLLANIVIWWLWIADAIRQEVILDLATTSMRVSVPGQALQQCRSDAEALMFARAIATVFDWPYDNPNLIEVWSIDNRRLFRSTRRVHFAYDQLLGEPGKVVAVTINHAPYNLIRHDGPRWSLRVAIPRPQGTQLYWQRMLAALQYPGLQANFWLSLALLLLGLWWAIERGLTPLRQLARQLARRSPGDLSPLGVEARYPELAPTVDALEALLAQLRQTLGREQALVQQVRQRLQTPMDQIAAGIDTLNHAKGQAARQAARVAVEQAIARASHLIRQVLDLARVERQTPLNLAQYDCAELVRDELVRMVPLAMARQIELSLDAPAQLSFVTERNALLMIVHNLLENAIVHGRESGVVQVQLHWQGKDLQLVVSDDGSGHAWSGHAWPGHAWPGHAPAGLEQVVDRFDRAAAEPPDADHGTPPSQGAGLGLAIVQQAVSRLGGTLQVGEGLQGRGCRFAVTIPPAVVAAGAMPGAKTASQNVQ